MKLETIIEKLNQNRIYTQCFIKGELINLSEESFIGEVIASSAGHWDRLDVLKNLSVVILKNKDKLLNVAKSVSRQSDYEIEKDIAFCAETFAYYSRCAHKDKSKKEIKSTSTVLKSLSGMILEDCPIFTTLGLLIAAPIAGGSSICLYVNSQYSVVSVCFAAVLIEAGLPKGVVNVVPYFDRKSLSVIAHHNLRIIGVLPEEVPKGQFHFNKALLKKHSQCPIIILKSADIDSAVDSIVTCTQSNEVLWFPNIIYVEEPCYEKFLLCLKFVVKNRNTSFDGKENSSEVDQMLDELIKEKNDSGVEVIELIHRLLKCVFLVNDNAALNSPVICGEDRAIYHRVISVIPIRTTQEALSFANSSTAGLAVSVWTNDAVETISMPNKLAYGTVWVNSVNHYNPAVPFSPWGSFGYGTFLGKRGFSENFYAGENEPQITERKLYSGERNTIFIKKDISSAIKQSQSAFSAWHKLDYSSKASFLETTASVMERTWESHFKTVLNETDESFWDCAVHYVNFWASYSVEKEYDRSFHEKNFQIVSRSEPLGVIAIKADATPVDELIFVISAALVFGNAVLVGISNDAECSIPASELENLFKTKPGLVNVVVDADKNLWSQFVSSADIASVWVSSKYSKYNVSSCAFRNIVEFPSFQDMIRSAEMYEVYATKQKSIWLPSLC